MKKIIFLLIIIITISCSSQPKFDKYIGLDIKSEEMQDFLKDFGNPEITKYKARTISDSITDVLKYPELTIQSTYPAHSYFSYKEKGIEIKLDDNDKVDAIFLFGEGTTGYRQYKGNLPFNLKFTDTKKNIVEKFGKPDETFSGSTEYNLKCIDNWKSKRISITYVTTDSTNSSTTISSICIFM